MGGKKITIADIAGKLGISPTTVSFVLNGRDNGISDATRDSVLKTAAQMGYKRTGAAGGAGWTKVAYVTSQVEFFNSGTSFFAYVYSHLQKRSMQDKIELFLLELNPNDTFSNCNKRLQEFRSIGIEVCLANSPEIVSCLASVGFKSILVQGGVMPKTVCVYCDDYAAGREAALYALKMGHKRAGMIFPENMTSPRFKGFYETFTSGGGICKEEHIWAVTFDHAQAAGVIEGLTKKHDKLPSLFYCFADNLMFPALRGFIKCGLKVPDDISLIGTDNLYWGSIATPAFTTVDLNEELFAEKISLAIQHVKNNGEPYHLAVPVKLIPRETVKKLNSK